MGRMTEQPASEWTVASDTMYAVQVIPSATKIQLHGTDIEVWHGEGRNLPVEVYDTDRVVALVIPAGTRWTVTTSGVKPVRISAGSPVNSSADQSG